MRRLSRTGPNHATYSIELKDNLVLLVDLDLGGPSVTNDAENVIADLDDQGLLLGRRVVYRDSTGRWDELLHDGHCFTRFAPFTAV